MSPSTRSNTAYIVVAAVCMAVAAVSLTVLTPRHDPIAKADALREEGRYAEALDRYQTLLAKDQTDEGALWGAALTHVARDDPRMATRTLSLYLQRHPNGEHAEQALEQLRRVRGAIVSRRQPSPEFAAETQVEMPDGPRPEERERWDRAVRLEQKGQLLDAVVAYAAAAETVEDGALRAAALERMARCEAGKPPYDYYRIRHFFLQASRAHRDLGDQEGTQRCRQLAYLAQEYARVKAEQDKLAAQQRELEALQEAQEALKAQEMAADSPAPQVTFGEALAALRAGSLQAAEEQARAVAGEFIEAQYVLGMVHTKRGLWEQARTELKRYLAEIPDGPYAQQARDELAAMRGRRPLLLASFESGAANWRLEGEEEALEPATVVFDGEAPLEGLCLRLEPGEIAYTSFEESAGPVSVEVMLLEPSAEDPPLPTLQFALYAAGTYTAAPLLVTERGYYFVGHRHERADRKPGWRRLVIDVTESLVSAQVDDQFIGEVPREAGVAGLRIETETDEGAGPVFIEEIRVVEHISTE